MSDDLVIYLLNKYGWTVLPLVAIAYFVTKNPLSLINSFRTEKQIEYYDPYETLKSELEYWIHNRIDIIDESEPRNRRILRDLLKARYKVFAHYADLSRSMSASKMDPQELEAEFANLLYDAVNAAEQAELQTGVPARAVLEYRKFSSPYVDSFIASSRAICLLRSIPRNEDKLAAIWTILAAFLGVVTRRAEHAFDTIMFDDETRGGGLA
jgi:hypothetical protein